VVNTLKDEVDKKWLAISYGCILLAIYFLFIAYCSISPSLIPEKESSNNYVVGNFTSGISEFSSSMSIPIGAIAIIALVFFLTFILLGTRAMGAAL